MIENPFTAEQMKPQKTLLDVSKDADINPDTGLAFGTNNVTQESFLDARRPAQMVNNPTYIAAQKRRGFWDSIGKGLKNEKSIFNQEYDPNYKPTWDEELGSGFGAGARAVAEVAIEGNEDVINARRSVEELRKTNPALASRLEDENLGGKALAWEQNAIKLAGGIGDVALTVTGAGALEKMAVKGLARTTFGLVAKKEGAKALEAFGVKALQNSAKGLAAGALYGTLYGMHEYPGDWKKTAEEAINTGVTFGAIGAGGTVLGGLSKALGGGTKRLAEVVSNMPVVKVPKDFVGGFIKAQADAIYKAMPIEAHLVDNVATTIKKIYGDVGEKFLKMAEIANADVKLAWGKNEVEGVMVGLFPAMSKDVGFGV